MSQSYDTLLASGVDDHTPVSHKIIVAVCVIRREQVEMLSFRLFSENLRFEIATEIQITHSCITKSARFTNRKERESYKTLVQCLNFGFLLPTNDTN